MSRTSVAPANLPHATLRSPPSPYCPDRFISAKTWLDNLAVTTCLNDDDGGATDYGVDPAGSPSDSGVRRLLRRVLGADPTAVTCLDTPVVVNNMTSLSEAVGVCICDCWWLRPSFLSPSRCLTSPSRLLLDFGIPP